MSEAVSVPSKAHLFIFESQEDDSQSVFGDRATAATDPPPTVNKDAAFSLTQVHLEEDKQRITELMDQTEQVSVITFFSSQCNFPGNTVLLSFRNK